MAEPETEVLPPPPALLSRNPLNWFRYFGPGAIVASVTIGSGEILFPSRGGAVFGYSVLWVILLVCLFKWVMAYTCIRHMVLSGGHPLERWRTAPGPPLLIHYFILLSVIATLPIVYAFLSGILGTACVWMFGIGDESIWATISLVTAGLLLLGGEYKFMERAQTAIVGIMLVCMLVAVLYLDVDWTALISSIVAPRWPVYPEWLPEVAPQMAARPPLVELMMAASLIGGSSIDYLSYASFMREKKWGRAHVGPADRAELEQTAALPGHPARLWLRAAMADTVISFLMVIIIAGIFCILGAVVLGPRHLVPDKVDLLNYQAAFLTSLSPMLEPLYKLAIFAAFFGSIYGSPELNYRFLSEMLNSTRLRPAGLSDQRLRLAVLILALGGGIAVTWLKKLDPELTLIDMFGPLAIVTGIVLSGFHCLINPWVDRHFLPARLRMPGFMIVVNILGGLIFILAGLKAFADSRHTYGYILFALVLVIAIALALGRGPIQRKT